MRGGFRSEPIAVVSIALANVLVFASELHVNDAAFVSALALIPYDVTHGIVLPDPSPPVPALTLLSSQFVHASWPHLIGNVIVLGLAGPAIERALGTLRFLAFYLICGTLGGIACVAAAPASHVPIVGASGAIAGVLGAYLILAPLKRAGPYGLFPPAIFIAAWALLQLEHGFGMVSSESDAAGGTAYFAHIGGFLAGVIGIELFTRRRSGTASGRFRP